MSELPQIVPLDWVERELPFSRRTLYNKKCRGEIGWLAKIDGRGQASSRLHVILPRLFADLRARGQPFLIVNVIKKVTQNIEPVEGEKFVDEG